MLSVGDELVRGIRSAKVLALVLVARGTRDHEERAVRVEEEDGDEAGALL